MPIQHACRMFAILVLVSLGSVAVAQLPDAAKVTPVKLFEVDHYCEGVCFDYDANGYVSDAPSSVQARRLEQSLG